MLIVNIIGNLFCALSVQQPLKAGPRVFISGYYAASVCEDIARHGERIELVWALFYQAHRVAIEFWRLFGHILNLHGTRSSALQMIVSKSDAPRMSIQMSSVYQSPNSSGQGGFDPILRVGCFGGQQKCRECTPEVAVREISPDKERETRQAPVKGAYLRVTE